MSQKMLPKKTDEELRSSAQPKSKAPNSANASPSADLAHLSPASLLQLQRSVGNRSVNALLNQQGGIQREDTPTGRARSNALTKDDPRMPAPSGRKRSNALTKNDPRLPESMKEDDDLDNFSGAEAKVIRTIDNASPEKLEKAVEALARAGVFGEAKSKYSGKFGEGEGTSKDMAGTKASAKGTQTVEKELVEIDGETVEIIRSLTYAMELVAKAGLEGELAGKLEKKFSEKVSIEVAGSLYGFVGAKAGGTGSVKIDFEMLSIAAEADFSAMAGVEVKAEGSSKLAIGHTELAVDGSVRGLAGAEANAKGSAKLSLDGVALEGELGAFAGAKLEAEASGALNYKGHTFFKITGTASVSAGAGAEAKGTFKFEKGKLTIGGKLSTTLGIGAGGGLETEIDFNVLALMIADAIRAFYLYTQPKNKAIIIAFGKLQPDPNVPLTEGGQETVYDGFYNAVYPEIFSYAKAKSKGSGLIFKTGGPQEIKADKIQGIIDKSTKNPAYQRFIATEVASQLALLQAVKSALEAAGYTVNSGAVNEGKLTSLEVE
ncbi:MAG: hypothetical protein AAFV98_00865 [Chloroflexota bacterium]